MFTQAHVACVFFVSEISYFLEQMLCNQIIGQNLSTADRDKK